MAVSFLPIRSWTSRYLDTQRSIQTDSPFPRKIIKICGLIWLINLLNLYNFISVPFVSDLWLKEHTYLYLQFEDTPFGLTKDNFVLLRSQVIEYPIPMLDL